MKDEKHMKFSYERTLTNEYIEDDTGDYVKSTCRQDGRFRFYLRAFKTWFYPCGECQKELYENTIGSDNLYLGNKDYDPPIELSRDWVIDDESWVELERRQATLKDYKHVYGYSWKKWTPKELGGDWEDEA